MIQNEMTKEQFADFMEWARKTYGLNKTTLGKRLNTTQQNISNFLSRPVSKNMLKKIKDEFPEYPLFSDSTNFCSQNQVTDSLIKVNTQNNEKSLLIPFVLNFPAAAGKGSFILDEVSVEDNFFFDKRFIKNVVGVTNTSSLYIVQAQGNSMYDKIQDRDLLIVDTSQIEGNGVFVINHNGNTRVKRIQKGFNGDILIISDNPDKEKYPDEILKAKDQSEDNFVAAIGKVVWNLSRGTV